MRMGTKLSWLRVGPKSSASCPDKRQERIHRHTERGRRETEAEAGGAQPQAQDDWDHQGLEETGRTLSWSLRGGLALLTPSLSTSALRDCERGNVLLKPQCAGLLGSSRTLAQAVTPTPSCCSWGVGGVSSLMWHLARTGQ